jgi:pimeloyl-ACP methyl ester carboxylesterase
MSASSSHATPPAPGAPSPSASLTPPASLTPSASLTPPASLAPRASRSSGLYDTSHMIELAGVRTHVQVWEPAGAARSTVVGLHHFYGSAQTFHRLGPLLADAEIRLVAFDRVGFGLTDRPHHDGRWTGPDAPYTRAFAIRQLAELLDVIGAPHAIVTGTSMGGTTALEFALAHPDRVQHVVPCSAPLTADASLSPWLRRALRTPLLGSAGPALVRRVAGRIDHRRVAKSFHDTSMVTAVDVDAHARFREAAGWDRALWWKVLADHRPRLLDRLPELRGRTPVTAIGATHDRLVRPGVAQVVARETGGRYLEVASGHLVHVEGAYPLARALADIVDRAEGRDVDRAKGRVDT